MILGKYFKIYNYLTSKPTSTSFINQKGAGGLAYFGVGHQRLFHYIFTAVYRPFSTYKKLVYLLGHYFITGNDTADKLPWEKRLRYLQTKDALFENCT